LEYGKDGDFTPVILRGVNVGDLYHFKKFTIEPPDYSYIAGTMNANCIRIAVHPNLWQQERAAVLAYLKQNVRNALNSGLFVIIDYHTIGFPDGYVPPLNDRFVSYIADFKLAGDFWNTVSREINDGRVLLELWNEPVSNKFTGNYAAMWKALKPYWEKLTQIIRDNRNYSVILAGGDYWAYELRGIKEDLLPDANTAYTWHVYGNHDDNDVLMWEKRLDQLHAVRPVVVTEWGFSGEEGDAEYAAPSAFADKFVVGFLDTKELHSLAWGYDPFYTPSMLKDSFSNFSKYGNYVVNYLQSCTDQVRP
jgi:aryl-phospho-beta-D-glucosidase BglC (GH1 family)